MLAGGPSSGNPLTKFDARASLKFGASYRLIDFPMANIINSGLKRAFVLTQFNSYTLNQHVQAAYPPEVFGFGSQGYARPAPASPATTAPVAPPISTRPNVPTEIRSMTKGVNPRPANRIGNRRHSVNRRDFQKTIRDDSRRSIFRFTDFSFRSALGVARSTPTAAL